eukprot:c14365_g1_i1.p1 GENE.c14365_g1_i1~~c14365_g1_i1.p1  ORF type:complete len:459 (-),score=108.13 c14365_g1_i1:474-1694(-)
MVELMAGVHLQNGHETPGSWQTVKKRVKAISAAKKVATGNVTFTNKMGVYAWDEVRANHFEYELSVCFQFGFHEIQLMDATDDKRIFKRFPKTKGFEGTDLPAFKFVSHFPETFASIRKTFEVDPIVFRASLGLKGQASQPNLRVVNRSMASGKSSSWFFFTSDMRFAIKTCTVSDFRCLKRILKRYEEHTKNPTLLPKYLGLYTIKFGTHRITFVVMNNVFAGYLNIHRRYDLKGSTYKRKASPAELKKSHCVFKDLDLLADMKVNPRLALGDDIHKIIEADARWLAKVGLMDYSFLMGLHYKNPQYRPPTADPVPEHQTLLYESHEHRKSHPGATYVETADYVAYIGIIDILTTYSAKKRMETIVTGKLALGRDVSCQHPRKYAKRFIRFLLSNTDGGQLIVTF